jgi:hypothetical protein
MEEDLPHVHIHLLEADALSALFYSLLVQRAITVAHECGRQISLQSRAIVAFDGMLLLEEDEHLPGCS